MSALLHSRIVVAGLMGALTGAASAAVVDYHAFTTWKSWSDLRAYDWRVAAFRICQGVVTGAVTAVAAALGTSVI